VQHAPPFWSKSRHADRRPRLLARARLIAALRRRLDAQGFVEVEPAILQASPGNQAHLHAFSTEMIGTDAVGRTIYLHTSPEFAMKKLLAAGEEKIFALSRVFRNRERGVLHAPEFTMLEWYRTGAPYEVLMEDCADILRAATRFFASLGSIYSRPFPPMGAALPIAPLSPLRPPQSA